MKEFTLLFRRLFEYGNFSRDVKALNENIAVQLGYDFSKEKNYIFVGVFEKLNGGDILWI